MNSATISQLQERLRNHSLYEAIQDQNNLKVFMQHHVYAVWDFMSLIKALQRHLAPNNIPWTQPKNARFANFINTLVLEEESDLALTDAIDSTHASHFQSYCQAMHEVGADTKPIFEFTKCVHEQGLNDALKLPSVPKSASQFMHFTFSVIDHNEVHMLAAAIAYGREILVPQLYRSIQQQLPNCATHTHALHAYLQRHIELDEQEHGPLAMQMVQELCGDSRKKQAQAIDVAEQALTTRIKFWNGIHDAISSEVRIAV